jgi:hypothetical protein
MGMWTGRRKQYPKGQKYPRPLLISPDRRAATTTHLRISLENKKRISATHAGLQSPHLNAKILAISDHLISVERKGYT